MTPRHHLLAGLQIALAFFALSCDIQADPYQVDLAMWLNAGAEVYSDAGTTLAQNGDLVQTWGDSSTNNRDLTDARAPIYYTNVVDGQPALRFNGDHALAWMAHVGPSSPIDLRSSTAFAVIKTDAIGVSNPIFNHYYAAGFSQSFHGLTLRSPGSPSVSEETGGIVGVGTNAWQIGSYALDFSSGGAAELYRGNQQVGSSPPLLTLPGSQTAIVVGAEGTDVAQVMDGSGDAYLQGYFAELLIYDTYLAPGSTEWNQTYDYLANKYPTTSGIPEPSTLILLLLGAAGLFACARRRRR